jgi:predicted dehydrogenase
MISWAGRTSPSFFLSSHDLDLLLWYFDDRVVEVYATAVHGVLREQGIDTPDAVQAQVRFAGGAVATLEACWTYPDTFPTMTDSFLELIFTDAVIHLDRKREQIEVATHERFSYPRNQLAGRVGGKPSGSTAAAVTHFVDAVLDRTAPLVTLDSSVHVTEVLVAIDESWRQGRPVLINDGN